MTLLLVYFLTILQISVCQYFSKITNMITWKDELLYENMWQSGSKVMPVEFLTDR